MAQGDMGRLLGALLGAATKTGVRPRTRRRAPARALPGLGAGGNRAAATALATLAGAVLGTMLKGGGQGTAAPAPAPRKSTQPARKTIDVAAPAAKPAPPAAPLPNPWSRAPAPAAPAAPQSGPKSGPKSGPDAEDAEALLIIRAMIACAKADGALDAAERAAIAGQLDQAGLDQASRDLVLAEFAAPASVEEIAAAVSDPVLAAQVYAAAFLAAGEVSTGERAWLSGFAARAGLDPRTAAAIEQRLAQ